MYRCVYTYVCRYINTLIMSPLSPTYLHTYHTYSGAVNALSDVTNQIPSVDLPFVPGVLIEQVCMYVCYVGMYMET